MLHTRYFNWKSAPKLVGSIRYLMLVLTPWMEEYVEKPGFDCKLSKRSVLNSIICYKLTWSILSMSSIINVSILWSNVGLFHFSKLHKFGNKYRKGIREPNCPILLDFTTNRDRPRTASYVKTDTFSRLVVIDVHKMVLWASDYLTFGPLNFIRKISINNYLRNRTMAYRCQPAKTP